MNKVMDYIESRDRFTVFGVAWALKMGATETGAIFKKLYDDGIIIEVSFGAEYSKAV